MTSFTITHIILTSIIFFVTGAYAAYFFIIKKINLPYILAQKFANMDDSELLEIGIGCETCRDVLRNRNKKVN